MIASSPGLRRASGFLNDHSLGVLLAVQFLSGVAAAPMLAFLPVYVDEVLKLDQDFTANARAVWLAGMGIFAVAGGALSDAAGRKFTIGSGFYPAPVPVVPLPFSALLLAFLVAAGSAHLRRRERLESRRRQTMARSTGSAARTYP